MSHKQTPPPPQEDRHEPRRKLMRAIYEDWKKFPHMTLVGISEKHSVTEGAMRCFLRKNNLRFPDGIDRSSPSPRYGWIMEGYNRGLELGLTARQASVWASEKSGTHIQRGDIQHYAAKFDLPLLTETDNGSFIGKYSKYG